MFFFFFLIDIANEYSFLLENNKASYSLHKKLPNLLETVKIEHRCYILTPSCGEVIYLIILQVLLQLKNVLQSCCNNLLPFANEILFLCTQVKAQAYV